MYLLFVVVGFQVFDCKLSLLFAVVAKSVFYQIGIIETTNRDC